MNWLTYRHDLLIATRKIDTCLHLVVYCNRFLWKMMARRQVSWGSP